MTPGVTSGSGSTASSCLPSVATGWEEFPGPGTWSPNSGRGRDLGAPPSPKLRLSRYTRRQEVPRGRRRRSPPPHSLKDVLRSPDLHDASRLPGVPQCPGTVRHRSSPAPPRPGRPASQRAGAVEPGARTPGSAIPRPSRTGLAPPRGAVLPSLLGAAQPSPAPPCAEQPSSALVKAQCAGAEPYSEAAGRPAPYYACAGLGGGTFWLVWRVAERFLKFSLDVAEPGGVCQSSFVVLS